MNKKVYFITGITGFIGSNIVKYLLTSREYRMEMIEIIGLVRDENKARKMYQQYDTSNMHFVTGCLEDTNLAQKLDCFVMQGKELYLLHCAATTKSSVMISNPVETADGIILGTKNVLELARRLSVKSMVYLSSMEVYGNIEDTGNLVTENTLGDLEVFHPRSCYPLGKRIAEHYCFIYYKEYGVPVKIARLAQVFGTGVLPGENRVFAQFADSVRKTKDIVLHTLGQSMGNYCETLDAVDAIFTLLNKGENGEAYNVVNEDNSMRIREMAELVADHIAHGKIKVIYDIPEENRYGYAGDTGLRLSSAKLRSLGWKPTKNLEEMYLDLIEWMQQ
jgi:nucleoside-diphosphate-sugar epimerase